MFEIIIDGEEFEIKEHNNIDFLIKNINLVIKNEFIFIKFGLTPSNIDIKNKKIYYDDNIDNYFSINNFKTFINNIKLNKFTYYYFTNTDCGFVYDKNILSISNNNDGNFIEIQTTDIKNEIIAEFNKFVEYIEYLTNKM